MTGIRRVLVVAAASSVLATVAVGTAQAVFESVATHTGSVATATVAPPTGITVTTTCDTVTATMQVSWTASTEARTTGYRVTLQRPGFTPLVVDTNVVTTSVQMQDAKSRVDDVGTFTVTTLTDTPWTGLSARTAPVNCP